MKMRIIQALSASLLFTTAVLATAKSPAYSDLLPKPVKGENWRPGVDYGLYLPPNPMFPKPSAGKVQVRIPFLYTYGKHVDNEYLQRWLKTKPDYIEVAMVPNIRWPHAREQARMYFTLQQMGREDLRLSLYDWIYGSNDAKADSPNYPVYHNLFYPDLDAIFKVNLEFAKKNGLDEKQFTDIYYSKSMKDTVARAEFAAQSNGFQEIVINGRYFTDISRLSYLATYPRKQPTDEEYNGEAAMNHLFRLVEYLAASEYARMNAEAAKAGSK